MKTRGIGMLEKLKSENGVEIPFSLLKIEIIKNIGGHEHKTVKPYLKMMLDLEMIKPKENDAYVDINI